MPDRPEISVVIPVYDCAPMLEELVSRLRRALSELVQEFEIVLIDDGSRDQSWQVVQKLGEVSNGDLVGIKLSRNSGQHNALLCGLKSCSGQFVVTMDGDLQHPPEEIQKLLRCQRQTGADIVYGLYDRAHHGWLRSAGSWLLRRASRWTANTIGDGSSFRLLSRRVVDEVHLNHHGYFLFLDEVIQWYTSKIATTEVTHHQRAHGSSSYRLLELSKLFTDVVVSYSALPLKLMTWIGLSSSILTFVLGSRFIYRRLVWDVPLGYTSLIVSIMFSTSLILFSLGIIGRYLHFIYQDLRKRPPYSIEKVIR